MNFIFNAPKKYVKCSNCKIFDSISPLIPTPLCDRCHQPLKEISEDEYKQKLYMVRKYKEEMRKRRHQNNNININNNNINNNNININNKDNNDDNNNYDQRHSQRNKSPLLSSSIHIDDNDGNNINNNNMNNNANNNNHTNISHHGHHGIKIIKITGGNHHGIHNILRIGGNNNSNQGRGDNLIIISPFGHHRGNSSEHINGSNDNNINLNNFSNRNEIMIQRHHHSNPLRIIVQRRHVPNEIFDPNFNLHGSRFDNVFQENFSSNFRSNIRGNFNNILLNILARNMEEIRRNKKKPISEQGIQTLKKFNLTEKYCQKGENGNFEKPNCCICLDSIEIGKEAIMLPCGHMFHSDCCITWLKKSNTCPICRFEIK